MKILDSAQMRAIDRRASERFGIPSIVLMENAAIAVAEALAEHYPEAARVSLFCGTGNNGGDGFAAARHLLDRGMEPRIVLIGDRSRIRGDALVNLEICDRVGIPIETVDEVEGLERAILAASRADVIVDAILGTGLERPAEGIRGDAIIAMSNLEVPIVAVDLPSGLDASSSRVDGPVAAAAVTVTFAAPKIAHVFAPAADCCGEVIVADVSIPDEAIEQERVLLGLTEPEEVAALVPPRPAESHKGTWGHVAAVAGSEGRSGAAILTARGAIRMGAGLVTVLTDAETAAVVDAASVESMSFAIARNSGGLERIIESVKAKDAAVVGPGLPDDEESYELVRELLPRIGIPLVVDASALNAFAGAIGRLGREGSVRVLTPHPGELGRLLGTTTGEVVADRVGAARRAAGESGAVVVLKGHQTLIASPDGMVRVNPTGNPGLASGGTGDVLSGMIAALLAQGHGAADAAAAAVWLHGYAADLLASDASEIGLRAMELADAIPRAIAAVRRLAAPER